jgi:carbon storage regulator
MLILNRNRGESIVIGSHGEVKIIILDKQGRGVRVGIEAPLEIPVHREEVFLKIKNKKPYDDLGESEQRKHETF